jgi:TetR/AcrR family transcriptional regulator, transcriptional repressor for nem operon
MGRTKEFVVEEALERARDVFWLRGFEGTSLTELTDGMQIQRASLYATFGSKAELFQQALAQYQARGLVHLETVLAAGTDPLDSLRRLLLTAVPEEGAPRRGCFCVNAATELGPHDPAIAAQLEAHFLRVRTILGRTVAAGQARGQLAIDLSPLEAGAYVLVCLNGLHVAAKTTTDPDSIRRSAERMLGALTA